MIFDFITAKIDYDEFEIGFSLLFNPTQKEASTFKKDISYIKNFEHIPQSKKFGSYMFIIYRLFDEVDDENCTKEGLRNYLLQLFVKLQNFQIEEK